MIKTNTKNKEIINKIQDLIEIVKKEKIKKPIKIAYLGEKYITIVINYYVKLN